VLLGMLRKAICAMRECAWAQAEEMVSSEARSSRGTSKREAAEGEMSQIK